MGHASSGKRAPLSASAAPTAGLGNLNLLCAQSATSGACQAQRTQAQSQLHMQAEDTHATWADSVGRGGLEFSNFQNRGGGVCTVGVVN